MFRRAFMIPKATREPAIRGQRMSAHILGVGIFMVGVMVLSVGLILGLGFPRYVNERIKDDQCILNENHRFYDAWVNDEDHVIYNRLYYWTIQNEADFLHGGANPELVERGPYVYSETRTKINVKFYDDHVSYQTMKAQAFSEEGTKQECGHQCSEKDMRSVCYTLNILDSISYILRKLGMWIHLKESNSTLPKLTVLNMDYLKRISAAMGLQNMVKKEIPSLIRDRLEQQFNRTSRSSVYYCLGCLSRSCWNNTSSCTERDLEEISIGRWFSANDTTSHNFMLAFASNFSTNFTKIETFYNFISQENAFLDSGNCLLNDRKSGEVIIGFAFLTSESRNFSNYSFPNYCVGNISINTTTSCGLLPAINSLVTFVKNCFGDRSNETFMLVIYHDSYYIDFSNTADVILTLLMLFKDFMAYHLMEIFLNAIKSADKNKTVVTLSQKDLALGYRTGDREISGILNHHRSLSQAYLDDPPITVSTCLDGRNVDNNMLVREYKGSQFAPQDAYPDKKIRAYSGYTSILPPSHYFCACVEPSPSSREYEIFVPELYKSLRFVQRQNVQTRGTTLYRYFLDEGSLSSGNSCNLLNTSGVFQFMSWVSNPYFQGSICHLTSGFSGNFSSAGNHLSQIDVEPWTGKIWRLALRLQINGGLNTEYLAPGENVQYLNKPIPIYWQEQSQEIAQKSIDYFDAKVSWLMQVSCGGLIGVTILAVIVMFVSVVVVVLSTRTNRVSPINDIINLSHS